MPPTGCRHIIRLIISLTLLFGQVCRELRWYLIGMLELWNSFELTEDA